MTDQEIQEAILRELEQDPALKAHKVRVTARDGMVILNGVVDSLRMKVAAERAARRVPGVKAVANELEEVVSSLDLQQPARGPLNDHDIARAVCQALEANPLVRPDRIRVTVREGWVTLEGEVDTERERKAAVVAARDAVGVKGLFEFLRVSPRVTSKDVRAHIQQALHQIAEQEARKIIVETTDSTVILRGSVHSWHERQAAELAARKTPGVTRVEDHITVVP